MGRMTLISAVLGTASGMLGAAVSALFSKLPSGAMIVLICTLFFLASLCFGTSRGLLVRWLHRSQLNRTVDRQHLLRAMYEILETSERAGIPEQERISLVPREALLRQRSWSSAKLHREIRRAERAGLIAGHGDRVGFTQRGLMDAVRLTRQHRLWELYLVTYADIAPALVDRGADAIEHVLEPGVVAELEGLLETSDSVVPASPHQLDVSTMKEVADP
jgi:manganese/zinc/iron transport system permease protein